MFLATLSSVPFAQVSTSARASNECRIRAYGATGNGHTLETLAINAAIADCQARGGGVVIVDAGIYRTGTVRLLDNITLRLDAGSVLLGSENLADYPRISKASEDRDTALIVAEHVHNIAIVGEGTIDGNGRAFTDKDKLHFDPYFDVAQTRQGEALVERMRQTREGPVLMMPRPGVLILLLQSDGIELRDFHVVDSPNWGVKVMCSENVSVIGLDVRNDMLIPNNDGLDVSASRDVLIADSYIEAGDDALVVGGPCADGWCQLPEESVVVSNVILRSRSAAIRIGPAAKDVRDITFENVIIRDSNRGINIQARAGETVENLLFTNVVSETRMVDGPWWGAGEPISITVARWAYPPWPAAPEAGYIRRVRFQNVIANSESPIIVYSTDAGHIEDVEIRDLSLTLHASPLQQLVGGNLDLQPTTPKSLGVTRRDLSAIDLHNVADVTLANIKIRWEGKFPDFYRHGVHADAFDGLLIDEFRGSGSTPGMAAIQVSDGRDFSLRHARSTAGKLLDSKGVGPAAPGSPVRP